MSSMSYVYIRDRSGNMICVPRTKSNRAAHHSLRTLGPIQMLQGNQQGLADPPTSQEPHYVTGTNYHLIPPLLNFGTQRRSQPPTSTSSSNGSVPQARSDTRSPRRVTRGRGGGVGGGEGSGIRRSQPRANADLNLLEAVEEGKDEMHALNLSNIRRMDSAVKRIVTSSSQVAIFKFENNKWTDATAVGSLFLYERSAPARVGLTVMNRLGIENWMHFLTNDCELVINLPYLLVKDSECIICIWFYNENDCLKFSTTLENFGYTVGSDVSAMNSSHFGDLKPPIQHTPDKAGNFILEMLTNSAKSDGSNLLTQLVATQERKKLNTSSSGAAGEDDGLVHPLPIKLLPGFTDSTLEGSPPINSGGKQIATSASSSFAAVNSKKSRPKGARALNCIMEQLLRGNPGSSSQTLEAADTQSPKLENPGFTMQTVEQLERGKKVSESGDSDGSESDAEVNADKLKKLTLGGTHLALSNDLRNKLGLSAKCTTTSSGSGQANPKIFDKMNVKSAVRSNSDSDDNNIGPSVSNQQSPSSPRLESTNGLWDSPPILSYRGTSKNFLNKGSAKKTNNTQIRIPTIDDLHGRSIDDVEPEELQLVLSNHPGKLSDLLLFPRQIPGTNETELTWTNVTRRDVEEQQPPRFVSAGLQLPHAGFSAQTLSEIGQFGVKDLPLTIDQFLKTFKVLLRDEEFVRKFHNAYLQVRSQDSLGVGPL